jgi:hypothetical protein
MEAKKYPENGKIIHRIYNSFITFFHFFLERTNQPLIINTVPYHHHPLGTEMNSHENEYKLSESMRNSCIRTHFHQRKIIFFLH